MIKNLTWLAAGIASYYVAEQWRRKKVDEFISSALAAQDQYGSSSTQYRTIVDRGFAFSDATKPLPIAVAGAIGILGPRFLKM